MADVDDYVTGRIVKDSKLAIQSLRFLKIPIIGAYIGGKLIKRIKNFEPKLVNMETASKVIHQSDKIAVGERVCRSINNSKLTEAVFLNELAEGMVSVGKARFVRTEEAIKALNNYPKNPLILSKVSGNYLEICCSLPADCVYWNMENVD
ncbi:MAG: hypothetical protein FJ150_10825 [Euryarchaeota archaeon]|nr:hypothetical protein [Euryarchaeota archaeon]